MKGRTFTAEFKLQIVRAALSGEKTVAQLCREHNLSDSVIHTWKKRYREQGEAAFTDPRAGTESPEEQELRMLRNRVAELERFIGRQAVDIEIVQKLQQLSSSASKRDVP